MDNSIHKMRECCMNISEIEAPAGLRGYYDVMNDCSNRPYLSTNVTGARKNFTSLQEVNECD